MNDTILTDMYTGKAVRVVSAEIRLSRNDQIDRGYYADLRMFAMLPGCRKARLISITPMSDGIWLKPLFTHNGEAHVKSGDWEWFVENLPVVKDDLGHIEVTSGRIAEARAYWGRQMTDAVQRQAAYDAKLAGIDGQKSFTKS